MPWAVGMAADRRFGMGRGRIFPASKATSLRSPLRRLVQSPARTVAAMGVRPGSRVLEVGSGPGYFSPYLAAAVGAIGSGLFAALDLQVEMLELAGPRIGRATATGRAVGAGAAADGSDPVISHAGLVNADAMCLPFAAASFDSVIVATVLGELPDRTRCLREVQRVLRPGGTASFSETRRDSDFIALTELRRQVEPCGFRFRERRGPAWQYVAHFETV